MITVVKTANIDLHPIVPVQIVDGATPVLVSGDRDCRCWLLRSSPVSTRVRDGETVTIADAEIDTFRKTLLYGHVRTPAEAATEAANIVKSDTARAKKQGRTQDLRDIKARIKAKAVATRTVTEKDTLSIVKFLLSEEE